MRKPTKPKGNVSLVRAKKYSEAMKAYQKAHKAKESCKKTAADLRSKGAKSSSKQPKASASLAVWQNYVTKLKESLAAKKILDSVK